MSSAYGKTTISYHHAVNPFIQAANSGDLKELQTANLKLNDLDNTHGGNQPLFKIIKDHKKQDLLDFCFEIAKRDIAQDTKERTLLHWAAKCNQSETVINALVKNHNINDANNPFRVTPLYMAAMEGHSTALRALLKQNPDLNITAINGASALHAAAEAGNTDCIQALLDAGMDVNKRCKMGGTALIVAAQRNHPATVKLLLAAGADPNAQLQDGTSALIIAAQFGLNAIIDQLLQANADCSLALANGMTASDVAKTNQHQELVAKLDQSQPV